MPSANPFDRWPQGFWDGKPYKLNFLGRGYEHLVYRVVDHARLVLKFSTHKAKEILSVLGTSTNLSREAELRDYALTHFMPDVRAKNSQIHILRRHFGYARTLQERRYLINLPIPGPMIPALFAGDYWHRRAPDALRMTEPVWTHLVAQAYCSAASLEGRVSFHFGRFPEDGPFDRERYTHLHRSLLAHTKRSLLREDFVAVQDCTPDRSLAKLLEMADTDRTFRISLEAFIRSAISYAENTGHILALAGADNVLFVRDRENWEYVLLDVLPIPTAPILSSARDIADRHRRNILPTRRELETAKRALNFIRVVNGVAACLKMPEQLTFTHEMAALSTLNLAADGTYSW